MISEIRARGIIFYLRTVQTTRWILIASILAFLALQTMLIAGFGMLITGFWLWNHEFATKVEILFWIFTGAFSVPLLLLVFLLSERLWLKISGAKDLAS